MEKNHSVDQNQLLHYYFQLKNNTTTTLRVLFVCFGGVLVFALLVVFVFSLVVVLLGWVFALCTNNTFFPRT